MDLTTASANVATSPALLPARASRARRRLPCNARRAEHRRRRPAVLTRRSRSREKQESGAAGAGDLLSCQLGPGAPSLSLTFPYVAPSPGRITGRGLRDTSRSRRP